MSWRRTPASTRSGSAPHTLAMVRAIAATSAVCLTNPPIAAWWPLTLAGQRPAGGRRSAAIPGPRRGSCDESTRRRGEVGAWVLRCVAELRVAPERPHPTPPRLSGFRSLQPRQVRLALVLLVKREPRTPDSDEMRDRVGIVFEQRSAARQDHEAVALGHDELPQSQHPPRQV